MKDGIEKRSGAHIGAANLQQFLDWMNERYAAGDWDNYLRGAKLNKTEIAAECGFARSVFAQNPAIKTAVQGLEKELQGKGILDAIKASQNASDGITEDATNESLNQRAMAAKSKAEARVKALEEQNASLKAEVASLRERLRRFEHLDDHLSRTGRLLPA